MDARRGAPAQEAVVQDVEIPVERSAEFYDFFAAQRRHEPGLAVPAAAARRPGLAAVPAGARPGLRELRLLGQRRAAAGSRRRATTTGRSRTRSPSSAATRACTRPPTTPARSSGGCTTAPAYADLKQEYDPDGRLAGLYDKCVRRKVSEGGASMPLAEVFERVAGPDADVEVHGLRRQRGGEPGIAGSHDHGQVPGRRVLPGAGTGCPRPGPGVRVRPPRRRRRHVHGPVQAGPGAADRPVDARAALRAVPARRLRSCWLRRVAPPPQEVRVNRRWMSGRRHSKHRDATAISHHYDVSNTFYEWVLGPSMAYTCACYPRADATLEQAQEHKFDLVARKLGLTPGMRLLDVGCGWGGMVMHAARKYRVQALGRHPVRAAGGLGAARDQGSGPGGPRRGPAPGLPRGHRDRVRRGQLDRADRAHRQGAAARATSASCTASSSRAAGC